MTLRTRENLIVAAWLLLVALVLGVAAVRAWDAESIDIDARIRATETK